MLALGAKRVPRRGQVRLYRMAISSYTYTEPSFKSFAFEGAKTAAIAGRKQSLFFQTTCAEGEKMPSPTA